MDAQSQYLVQALQAMGQGAPTQATYQDPAAMAAMAQKRQAAAPAPAPGAPVPAHPSLGHNLQMAGENLMHAPGRMMGNLQQAGQNVAQLPGDSMGGLQALAARFGIR